MTAVPPPGGSGFFGGQPLANVLAQTTIETILAGSATPNFGPFDCSQYLGARFSFQNNATGVNGAMVVQLNYYDDETTAAAIVAGTAVPVPSMQAAQRAIVIGPNCTADLIAPHLADWLVVHFICIDAGSIDMTWGIAHRNAAPFQWSLVPSLVLGVPTTAPSVLSLGVGVALPAGTTNVGGPSGTGGAGCKGVYGGPAYLWASGPSATSGYNVFVQTRDYANVFQTVLAAKCDAAGFINLPFELPPIGGADIRIHAVNNSGGASTISWTICADDTRVGG